MAHMGAVLMVESSNKHLRIGMQYRTRGFHHYNLRVFIHFFRNIPLKIKMIKCLGFVLIQRINYFDRRTLFWSEKYFFANLSRCISIYGIDLPEIFIQYFRASFHQSNQEYG